MGRGGHERTATTCEELLGFGGAGEVWRGRTARGEAVALRKVPAATPQVREAVTRAAAVLAQVSSPHLVRLRQVQPEGAGLLLVLDLVTGSSLRALVARFGHLTAGQAVTVVAPLAGALAQLHEAGLTHGRVGVSSVLVDESGRPVLDGAGQSLLWPESDRLDPSGALGASADVWGLGTLITELVGDLALAPAGLVDAVRRAVDPDPRMRGSAGELAAALLASCPAEPLPGRAVPVRASARARRDRRSLALPGLAASGVLLVLLGGWVWGRGTVERPTRLSARVDAAPDWPAVLGGLERTRAQAFASGGPLTGVWSSGAGLTADQAQLDLLAQRHLHAIGLQHDLVSVRVLQSEPQAADLEVESRLRAHDVVGPGTSVHVPTGPLTRWDVRLVHDQDGWRLLSMARTDPS